MERRIRVEKTKSGYPALWEAGGGATNTGDATIIADENGRRKQAIYVKRAGLLANAKHALIPVVVGDIIVNAYHHSWDFWTKVQRIKGFDGEFAVAELIYEFRDGRWNHYPSAYLQPAITAAIEKAKCYHCGGTHYIR